MDGCMEWIILVGGFGFGLVFGAGHLKEGHTNTHSVRWRTICAQTADSSGRSGGEGTPGR